jgi:hypothetical protein
MQVVRTNADTRAMAATRGLSEARLLSLIGLRQGAQAPSCHPAQRSCASELGCRCYALRTQFAKAWDPDHEAYSPALDGPG